MALRTTPQTKRKPTGDTATIARKRFYRAAERKLKDAENAVGATASRLRYLAKLDLQAALDTYSKSTTQKFSKPIQKLAGILDVNLEEERQRIKQRSDKVAEKIREAAIDLGEESRSMKRAKTRDVDTAQMREEEATAILNSPIGNRIFGGTIDLWRDKATVKYIDENGLEKEKVDLEKIYPILFEYFKVDNRTALVKAIEDITGETLYKSEKDDAFYESAKMLIQDHIASDNSLVQ